MQIKGDCVCHFYWNRLILPTLVAVINEKMSMRKVEKQHIKYLNYHRKKVFLK
jgi:hypothetical protein